MTLKAIIGVREIEVDERTGAVISYPFAENGVAEDHFPDGRVRNAITRKDGVRHGKSMRVYDDGSRREADFLRGKLNGWGRDFNPQNQLLSETLYLNGEPQEKIEYHPGTHRIMIKHPFQDGIPHGDQLHFNYDGDLVRVVPLQKGIRQGQGRINLKQGNYFVTNWENDGLAGTQLEYDANGALAYSLDWKPKDKTPVQAIADILQKEDYTVTTYRKDGSFIQQKRDSSLTVDPKNGVARKVARINNFRHGVEWVAPLKDYFMTGEIPSDEDYKFDLRYYYAQNCRFMTRKNDIEIIANDAWNAIEPETPLSEEALEKHTKPVACKPGLN